MCVTTTQLPALARSRHCNTVTIRIVISSLLITFLTLKLKKFDLKIKIWTNCFKKTVLNNQKSGVVISSDGN